MLDLVFSAVGEILHVGHFAYSHPLPKLLESHLQASPYLPAVEGVASSLKCQLTAIQTILQTQNSR
jgi:hypothetical protein